MCVDLETSGSEEEVETESDCLPSFSRPQPDVWDSEGKVVIKDPLDNVVTLDHKKKSYPVHSHSYLFGPSG